MSSPIGCNRLDHEGQQMSLLLPTTYAHCQDLFDKAVPLRAVRMTRLSTGLTSTRHTGEMWRHGGWIEGVLGMRLEPGLQLSALSLKEQQLLLMIGKLLLLEGQDVQAARR